MVKIVNLTNLCRLGVVSVLAVFMALFSVKSLAQQPPFVEIFTEKWPPSASELFVTLTTQTALANYLRANYGKLGELAAKQLDECLKSFKCRAKISAQAFERALAIFQNSSKSNDEKAKEFLRIIEEDLGPASSSPTGRLGIVSKYAASYSVLRLTWNRQAARYSCSKQICTCPNSSGLVPFAQSCQWTEIIGGQQYFRTGPPNCSTRTDAVDIEPEYKIYRGSKLLAIFPERRQIVSSQNGFPVIGNILGFLDLKLSAALPVTTSLPIGIAGPFYDFDPQFVPLGTSLGYTITGQSQGCGSFYDNSDVGILFNLSESVAVDADGDGRPDYYPLAEWYSKLPQLAGPVAIGAILPILLD
jgi:hypothetical protein